MAGEASLSDEHAYQEGARAYLHYGVTVDRNPFNQSDPRHAFWNAGYLNAKQADLEEDELPRQ